MTDVDVDKLVDKLVAKGFGVQKMNDKEVTALLDEDDNAASLASCFQKAGFVPLFVDVLPEEASFGTAVRLVPVTTLDEVPDDN